MTRIERKKYLKLLKDTGQVKQHYKIGDQLFYCLNKVTKKQD